MPVGPLPTLPPVSFRGSEVFGGRVSAGVTGAGPTQTTIRYVRKSGSDANGGTGPGDAWLTINKALTTAPAGSIIYIGAGTYRENGINISITPTAGSPVSLIGDVDGLYTGDPGMVMLSAYASDIAAPGSFLINLNGKSFLTFKNIFFVGGTSGTATCFQSSSVIGSQSTDINMINCAFTHATGTTVSAIQCSIAHRIPCNWNIDRCIFNGVSNAIIISAIGSSVANEADWDCNFNISNTVMIGAGTQAIFQFSTTGTTGKAGGGKMRNCFLQGSRQAVYGSGQWSTTMPFIVTGCIIVMTDAVTGAITASTANTIIEDYNVIYSPSARSGVTAGAHSRQGNGCAFLIHFGQERIWGGQPRAYGEPLAGSFLVGYGTTDASNLYDFRGNPRPNKASLHDLGPFQRGNNYSKETGTVNTGTNGLSITGEGYQDFEVLVDAGPVTFSIYSRYDSTYLGPLPQLQVLANGEVGVGGAMSLASKNGLNAWEQLSVTINPTSSGIVTVRVVSGDTSGAGHHYVDTFSVA